MFATLVPICCFFLAMESISSQFDPASVWQSSEVANTFTDIRNAIPLASEQLDLMERVIRTFQPNPSKWLDLGCGDGALGRKMIQAFPSSKGVMMDFSEPMLETARSKLLNEETGISEKHVKILHGDFSKTDWRTPFLFKRQEHDEEEQGWSTFDVIVSGFAIHHLPDNRKRDLYREIYEMLSPGGVFLNLEHVASPDETVEGIFDEAFVDSMYKHYQGIKTREECEAAVQYDLNVDREANVVVPVETQCQWLREIGYQHVDCYFKFLILALFGGVKNSSSTD